MSASGPFPLVGDGGRQGRRFLGPPGPTPAIVAGTTYSTDTMFVTDRYGGLPSPQIAGWI